MKTNSFLLICVLVGSVFAFNAKAQSPVSVNITAFLQGPMTSNGSMTNYIQVPVPGLCSFSAPRLPLVDPYGLQTSYSDINNVCGTVGTVVDWVKVEIRQVSAPSVILEAKALLLKPNGHIVDTNGNLPTFATQTGPVYLIVRHRNHLSVVSNAISSFSGNIAYDFSTALSQAYTVPGNPSPMILSNGKWCLWAGDVNSSEIINNSDLSIVSAAVNQGRVDAYLNEDLDMNGIVNIQDLTIVSYAANLGIYSPMLSW
jgi:hypothetical protein